MTLSKKVVSATGRRDSDRSEREDENMLCRPHTAWDKGFWEVNLMVLKD